MAKGEIHSFSSGAKSKLQYLINSLPVLCLLIILDFAPISLAATVVDSFPGYTGKLPFRLETGSSECGLCSELANRSANVQTESLFMDKVGTGFSYSKTPQGYYSDDIKAARQNYDFLKKWLQEEHSELQENPLYIAGSSYSGIPLPLVVQEILHGNKAGAGPLMNLKGYILGNPFTEKALSSRYKFAHRVSLLSDELYEATKESCHENYEPVDPRNTRCLKNIQAISNDIDPLFLYHILKPSCNPSMPPRMCPGDEGDLRFIPIWANNLEVRKALHIRQGTKPLWIRCNRTIVYTENVKSSFSYHQNFTEELLHALIYSGDQDLAIPYVGTLEWITRLNLPIIDRWKPWFTKGQVAGYTTKFSNGHYRMTFVTVKGGGHTSQEEKPRECFDMFTRWLGCNPSRTNVFQSAPYIKSCQI